MINAPCKDCKKRHKFCHSSCVEYLAFKDDLAKVKAVRQAENSNIAFDIDRMQRYQKFKKRHKIK